MRLTVRRSLAILLAAPLALVAIAAAAPAANAGGNGGIYGGDRATFSITIGGYGTGHGYRHGQPQYRHANPRRHHQPRHARGHHQRDHGHGRARGHGHSHGYADRHARPRGHADRHTRTYGRTDGSHYRGPRYAGRGVGYGCHIGYRHGQPVTICRDGHGVPFIVGNRY